VEKALYWKSRALEKLGRTGEARETQARLSRDFPHSYYTRLLSDRGSPAGPGKGSYPALRENPLPRFVNGKNLRLEKGRLLARFNLLPLASAELEAAEEEGGSPEEVWLEISRVYREAEEYYRSNLLVRRKFTLKPLSGRSSGREKSVYLLAYPLGGASMINRYAKERKLDPALLCAVILEESRFHSQAVSAAGARGLMQLMPPTGAKAARELKVPRFSGEQLFDPEMNVRLGSWYLAKMLEEFGGKTHLALAAYNAGPHMVRKWLAGSRSNSEDEFVESIPYSETRNYVVRVMTSARIYRALY
jgi:soluble lytic murein transglycosylase